MRPSLLIFIVFCFCLCVAVPGDISQKKCEEYDKLTSSHDVYIPVFLPGQRKKIKEKVCYIKPTFVSGGVNAEKGEFPHMALLGYKQLDKIVWRCGGSLISDQYVLTAGHCINDMRLGYVTKVRLGSLKLTDEPPQVQEFEVANYTRHPNYVRGKRYHDIALLKLSSKANFNKNVRPACIHTGALESIKFVVTGWGLVDSEIQEQSNILQKATVDIFSKEECNEHYQTVLANGVIDDIIICAGGKVNNTDTCQGDSGGPLQIKNPKTTCMYSIAGITSFGMQACGNPGVPAVYTRVSNYVDWIESIVWA